MGVPIESKRPPVLTSGTHIQLSVGNLVTLGGVVAACAIAWSHIPNRDEVRVIAGDSVRTGTSAQIEELRELKSRFNEEQAKNDMLTQQVQRLELKIDQLLKPKNPTK